MAYPTPLVVSTTFDVQGRRVREYKGVVRGITVRAPTISQGIQTATLPSLSTLWMAYGFSASTNSDRAVHNTRPYCSIARSALRCATRFGRAGRRETHDGRPAGGVSRL